ncbi:MAG TPA: tetratricopeptide repeat protein [Gammaproteobacteria bacterium]|nr:tetratricopeptide repeat protein [Gammaproteobacteria bacterium]
MRFWLSLILIAFSFSAQAQKIGAQHQKSNVCADNYKKGNYALAFTQCEQSAQKGNIHAQSTLGLMYFYGQGTVNDNDKAAKWFEQAALKNDAISQFHLGRMFSLGLGVEINDAKAMHWFLAAAKQGIWEAQLMVSLSYRLGIGSPKDTNAAYMWYQSAIKNGMPYAQEIKRENFQTRPFALNANLPGHPVYLQGMNLLMGIEGDPDPKNAAIWFEQAADLGHPDAQFNLAILYLEGDGIEKNEEKAYDWFLQASEQDHKEANAYLAFMNLLGIATAYDPKVAIELYISSLEDNTTPIAQEENIKDPVLDAAEKGNPQAQYEIGLRFLHGDGVKKDSIEAFEWLQEAATLNHNPAQYELGMMFLEGKGVAQDSKTAIHWLTKAAENNNPQAQYELGLLYFTGKFLQKNVQQAYAWFNVAASQDIVEAHAARSLVIQEMTAQEIEQAENLSRPMHLNFNKTPFTP